MTEPGPTTTRSLLRRALPAPVVSAIQVFRHLPPASRLVFARVWFRRLFSRATPLPPGLPHAPHLLFVCHGNILRSAVAEALYRNRVGTGLAPGDSFAESAGTAARDGNPADPRGKAAARDMGLDLEPHRAERLKPEQVSRADLILVMDFLNEADVVARFPAAAPKVRLLGSFISENGKPFEIRDPYVGTEEDVRQSFRTIAQAVDALAATLSLAESRAPGNSG